jgi:hypothetical protein
MGGLLYSFNLTVIWRHNKKAWMSAAKTEERLNMFIAKMKKENRNAILFLDNATCHPKVTLSNVNVPGSQQMQQVYYSQWIWVLFTHSNHTTYDLLCNL